MSRDELNRLSESVLACAFRVHSALGPGLLESVYKSCLAIELRDAGFAVEVEYPCPVVYKGQQVAEIGYQMDLLVEKVLVVEIKSVEVIHPVHLSQLLSYLRLSDLRYGLVLNFNTEHLRDGVKRVVNRF
jgi:GxxExxY protein